MNWGAGVAMAEVIWALALDTVIAPLVMVRVWLVPTLGVPPPLKVSTLQTWLENSG